MSRRLTVLAVAAVLGAATPSPVLGYSAEVRERMVVRNLAPPRLDDSLRPVLARDAAPGAGIFEYGEGPVGYGWPLVAAGLDSIAYNIAVLDSGGGLLSRTRISAWPLWDSVTAVADSGNQPMYETHNIASSHVSNKICITWVRSDTSPMLAYYSISSDGGATWDSVKQLGQPAAYGGDTLTSFHVSSLYPFYDADDRLSVVAAVHPIVHDTSYIMPAGIWHWCPDNNPSWRLLRRAGCAPENLGAPVGYNALYACRPSGCGISGSISLVAWEQSDSANVDPRTNLLRAGIHLCAFEDGGAYLETLRMTEPGPYSCRFPVPDMGGSETAFVVYEIDEVAGFSPLGQGPCTQNPVLCRQVTFPMRIDLGDLDTIGGTTYDLQACGPMRTLVRVSPGNGVHAAWMCSQDTTGAFPDLNMRYNFYDCWNHLWNWADFDFMQSGVNVFPYRTGLGCMDVDTSGVAVISACTPPPLPQVAVEESHGPQAPCSRPTSSIVRGVLRMPSSLLTPNCSLLAIDGRKVLDLHPGANDVRALAPGVYFLREEQAQAQAQVIRKVIVTR